MINYIIEQYTIKKRSLRDIGRELGYSHLKIGRLLRAAQIIVYPKRRAVTLVEVLCRNCDKPFFRYAGILNSETYCSINCYNLYRDNHKHTAGEKQLTSRGYLKFRTRVLAIFPNCVLCGATKNLHIHHIIPRRINDELVLSPLNVITLCRRCHCMIRYKEDVYANHFLGLVSKVGELLESPNVKSRAISSQALEGNGSNEGSETMQMSPNNNSAQECPPRKGRYSPSCTEMYRTIV